MTAETPLAKVPVEAANDSRANVLELDRICLAFGDKQVLKRERELAIARDEYRWGVAYLHGVAPNSKAAKAAGAILKGEAEFSPDKATEIFTQMHEISVKFGDYFPEDSKTGGKTEAAPAIWEKPEAFKAALAKYQEDTQAAVDAAPQDVDTFKQAFGMVAQNCKGCHEDFRIDTDN